MTSEAPRPPRGSGRPTWEIGRSGSFRAIAADAIRRLGVVTTYAWSRVGRRDRWVWVFGNVRGYRDNPRYLAEYVASRVRGVEPWWIARSDAEASAARSAGLQVAMRGERDAAGVLRRAGVAFFSNGLQDLEPKHLGGAFFVDLGHGKGLKRILLDMDTGSDARRSLPRRAVVALQRWIARMRLAQIDMIVAPGEWARARYGTAYRAPASKIPVLGTPRFDVILDRADWLGAPPHLLRDRYGLDPRDHVVLWLPTWREAGDASWLPSLDVGELETALAGTKVVIAVKPHPYSDLAVYDERIPEHPRLRRIPENDDVDVNLLLRDADALITDYSSVAFDFALLDRPLHFFAPDIDTYRDGAGLYEPFEWLTNGRHHRDWGSLLAELRASAGGDDEDARAVARQIRERAGFVVEPGSCERIVVAVAASVDLELDHATD